MGDCALGLRARGDVQGSVRVVCVIVTPNPRHDHCGNPERAPSGLVW